MILAAAGSRSVAAACADQSVGVPGVAAVFVIQSAQTSLSPPVGLRWTELRRADQPHSP